MDSFRGAAAAACILGLVFAVFKELLPTEKFSKQLSILFSLMLITAVIRPLTGFEFDELMEIRSDEPLEEYEERINTRLNLEIQNNLCDGLNEILSENNIYPIKIIIDINNFSDGSISIEQAEITVPENTDIKKAKRIAAEALGECKISVITAEEQKNDREVTE